MTLKEQIKECKKIIAQLKKDIVSFEASSVIDNSYEEKVKRFTNYLNFYKDILNSLEMLEIFKSLGFELQTTTLGNNLFFSTYLKSALLTEEQYTKLKEWSKKRIRYIT